MHKARFTEEQMVAMIARRIASQCRCCGQAVWDQRADDLHMAQAVRWLSGERGQTPEAARGREAGSRA